MTINDKTRRDMLKIGGVSMVAAFSGCLGDSSGDVSPQDIDWPEFDPNDVEGSLPQPALRLHEEGVWQGTSDELEAMAENPMSEPLYGPELIGYEEDESEWMDPDPLVFSVSAHEDPGAYVEDFAPVVENLEEELDREIEFFSTDSVAAQVEAMRSERLHVSRIGAGILPWGVALAGAMPHYMGLRADGGFGYKLYLITQIDNDEINSVEDLQGKYVAHTSEGSNSGNMAPQAFFRQDFGIVPGEDYEVDFSGSHENSILGVLRGDYDAAPVSSSGGIRNSVVAGHINEDEDVKVCYISDPFPADPFCNYYKLHPDVREGVHRAFMDYDYSGSALEDGQQTTSFVEIDYYTHWNSILTIQKDLGEVYTEDEL